MTETFEEYNQRLIEEINDETSEYVETNFVITYGENGLICYGCAHCNERFQVTDLQNHNRYGRLITSMRRHLREHGIAERYGFNNVELTYRFLRNYYQQTRDGGVY